MEERAFVSILYLAHLLRLLLLLFLVILVLLFNYIILSELLLAGSLDSLYIVI